MFTQPITQPTACLLDSNPAAGWGSSRLPLCHSHMLAHRDRLSRMLAVSVNYNLPATKAAWLVCRLLAPHPLDWTQQEVDRLMAHLAKVQQAHDSQQGWGI